MTGNLDIELLQARWVLGDTGAEELVQWALAALEGGLNSTALQQLAGLSRPTLRDVGSLPGRVFREIGLKTIDPNEAADLILTRACRNLIVASLLQAFPEFRNRCKRKVISWRGNPGGPYSYAGEFADFVIEDLHEMGSFDETQRAFQLLEKLLVNANQETRDLIGFGFFETLQTVASHRAKGNKPYEQFLGPTSKKIWKELQKMWSGKSSLMDVIRAERKASDSRGS